MESRIEALEIKLMHAEDQLESLNLTVYRQQQRIEWLEGQFKAMREQIAAGGRSETRRPEDEIPPHY
ncbi:MAG: SlyX family protein [Rhodocyclaceae bacterium]|nr:SlyX family protein [Rhodocyclaceae bacterium]